MSQPQPTPSPYYPPSPPPHTHDKYVGAIIAVGIVALILGAAVGYGTGYGTGLYTGRSEGTSTQPQQPSFTFVHGTVDSGTSFTDGWIYFDNQYTGTLTSTIFPTTSGQLPHGYQVYLPSGKGYGVTLYYRDSLGSVHSCAGRPNQFTPTGSDYTQNFIC
jgi:hypothetical protein